MPRSHIFIFSRTSCCLSINTLNIIMEPENISKQTLCITQPDIKCRLPFHWDDIEQSTKRWVSSNRKRLLFATSIVDYKHWTTRSMVDASWMLMAFRFSPRINTTTTAFQPPNIGFLNHSFRKKAISVHGKLRCTPLRRSTDHTSRENPPLMPSRFVQQSRHSLPCRLGRQIFCWDYATLS